MKIESKQRLQAGKLEFSAGQFSRFYAQAEEQGFKVTLPGFTKDGVVNDKLWWVAKDKEGNFRGEFTKDVGGHLLQGTRWEMRKANLRLVATAFSDAEIIKYARQAGLEKCISTDHEGGLTNKDELVHELTKAGWLGD